jgi:hypothetical protein
MRNTAVREDAAPARRTDAVRLLQPWIKGKILSLHLTKYNAMNIYTYIWCLLLLH